MDTHKKNIQTNNARNQKNVVKKEIGFLEMYVRSVAC